MPWEVALACDVHGKGSHDLEKNPQTHGLYVTYLSRLLTNPEFENLQGIVMEVFESDHTLLSFSLSRVLKEGVWQYDHTHTEKGLPRWVTH